MGGGRAMALPLHGSTPKIGTSTKFFTKTPTSFGRMRRTEHPMTSGWLAGTIEITVTYPLEFIKTQLQLQQQVSST